MSLLRHGKDVSKHMWKSCTIVKMICMYANLAIRVTALRVLLVTMCISQILGGLVAFR